MDTEAPPKTDSKKKAVPVAARMRPSSKISPEKLAKCAIRLVNAIPRELRNVEHIRAASNSGTGKPEKIIATRFSVFVPDPSAFASEDWNELMIADSESGKLFHTATNVLIDDDTLRILGMMEVTGMDEDALIGIPSLSTCRETVHMCHNCGDLLAVVETRVPIPGNADKPVLLCRGCGYARYCSERCALRAWALGHHRMCGHIRRRLHGDAVVAAAVATAGEAIEQMEMV
jgi:hypothetical protein